MFASASGETCLRAGFRKVCMRGDTEFSQTKHLDRWNDDGRVGFIFGYDARDNLKDIAEHLPETACKKTRSNKIMLASMRCRRQSIRW